MVLVPLICRGKGYPTFQTRIFNLHLLPAMWPDMVEFFQRAPRVADEKEEEEEEEEEKEEERSW